MLTIVLDFNFREKIELYVSYGKIPSLFPQPEYATLAPQFFFCFSPILETAKNHETLSVHSYIYICEIRETSSVLLKICIIFSPKTKERRYLNTHTHTHPHLSNINQAHEIV